MNTEVRDAINAFKIAIIACVLAVLIAFATLGVLAFIVFPDLVRAEFESVLSQYEVTIIE